jgi:predicted transcriptional regulator
MVLESKEDRTVLHSKGRLVERSQKYFSYAGHCFELDTSPSARLAGQADVQGAIVDYLEDGPALQKQIAEDLGLHKSHVSTYVKKLADKGIVRNRGRGKPIELASGDMAAVAML